MIRALIVDDEPPARDRLKQLLAAAPDIELVGEAVDGMDALEKIRRLAPGLVFMDVHMPGLTGVQLVEALEGGSLPYLIFTTAYGEYALRAFELDAVDYLLKPFDAPRLDRALVRVRQRLSAGAVPTAGPELARLAQELARLGRVLDGVKPLESLIVHVGNKLRVLDPNKVRYIEAEGNYVRINGEGEPFLARERLAELETRLKDSRFLRIHRSLLVNLAYLRELRTHEQGGYEFCLEGGERFVSSASYRERVRQTMKLE